MKNLLNQIFKKIIEIRIEVHPMDSLFLFNFEVQYEKYLEYHQQYLFMKRTSQQGSDKKVSEKKIPEIIDQRSTPTSSRQQKPTARLIESSPNPKSFDSFQPDNEDSTHNIQVMNQLARIAQKWARYRLMNGFNGLRINSMGTSITGYKTVKLIEATKKIIFRWKNQGWNRLIQNKNKAKKRDEATRRLIFLITGLNVRLKRTAIIKMRGNAIMAVSQEKSMKSFDNTPSKSSKVLDVASSSKSFKSNVEGNVAITDGMLLEKMILSPQSIIPLKKMQRYDKKTFFILSTTELKQAIQLEKKRLLQVKNADRNLRVKEFDNQILVNVLINHIRALVQTHEEKEHVEKKLILMNERVSNNLVVVQSQQRGGSFNSGVARKYEVATKQIETSDEQIRVIIESQTMDYDKLVRILRQQVQKFKKNRNDKLILSRIRLSQIIINLVANLSNGQGGVSEKPHHHFVQIINQLVNKVKQLSTICQQIPQLETFKRTLSLSEVSHEQYFNKIVNVIIALHHRINQLMRIRPEDMLGYIDKVREQCKNIEAVTDQFIEAVQNDVEELNPVVFNMKKGSYPQQFNPVHRNIIAISKQLIKERDFSFGSQEIIERVKIVIQIFWNVLSGLKSFQREWKIAKQNTQVSEVERQVLTILDECLDIFYNRLQISERKAQDMEEMFERKRNQTSLYHQKLELQINSLLTDFQNTTMKNQQLVTHINQLMNQKAELQSQLRQALKGSKDKLNNEMQGILNQNQQLKATIAELTTSHKRAIKQYQSMNSDKILTYQSQVNLLMLQKEQHEQEKQSLKKKIQQINQRNLNTIQQLQQKTFQVQTANTRYEVIKRQSDEQLNKMRTIIRQLEDKRLQLQGQNRLLENQNKMAQRNHTKIMEKFEEANLRMNQNVEVIENQYQNEIIRLTKQLQFEKGRHLQHHQEFYHKIETKNIVSQNTRQGSLQNQIKHLRRQLQTRDETINSQNNSLNGLRNQIIQINQQIKMWQNTAKIAQQMNIAKEQGVNQTQNNLLKQKLKQSQLQVQRLQRQIQNFIKNSDIDVRNVKEQFSQLHGKLQQLSFLKAQNQFNKVEFLKKQSYILYLQEQVKGLQQVISVLADQNNELADKYRSISTSYNHTNLFAAKDQQIRKLKRQIDNFSSQQQSTTIKTTKIVSQSTMDTRSVQFIKREQSYQKQLAQLKRTIMQLNLQVQTANQQLISKKTPGFEEEGKKEIERQGTIIKALQIKLVGTERQLSHSIQEIQRLNIYIESLLGKQSVSQQWLLKEKGYIDELTRISQQFSSKEQLYQADIQNLQHQIGKIVESSQSVLQGEVLLKEQEYINEIMFLRQELDRQIVVKRADDSVRIIGQTLQELIARVDRDNEIILGRINEIIRDNDINIELERRFTPEQIKDVNQFIEKNKALVDLAVTLLRQRQKMLVILRNYPQPEHLTEFMFRILLTFSKIPEQTEGADAILDNLFMIRDANKGPQYFKHLQDYVRWFYDNEIVPRLVQNIANTHHQVTIIQSRSQTL